MSQEGQTAKKRALDDDLEEEDIDVPPKKKQRLSSTNNNHNNSDLNKEKKLSEDSNDNDNDIESKNEIGEVEKEDVRTVKGFDRPTHFEIEATNPEKMIDFYTKVFNWKFTPMNMPTMKYWGITTGPYEFSKDPQKALATYGIAGGMAVREGDPPKGDNVNTFLLYIDVTNIDNTLKLISDNGGTILKAKTDIGGMGWLARAKDIEGGIIGLWQNVKSPHPNDNNKDKNQNGHSSNHKSNSNSNKEKEGQKN